MKVLTFSKVFPAKHPKAGEATEFVTKILAYLEGWCEVNLPKYHTIRAGTRWKVGDMASLRVWSGPPYRSKQVEFAQVEVVKTWDIDYNGTYWFINDAVVSTDTMQIVALNDGLTWEDFSAWFAIHPKMEEEGFCGQIISWNPDIIYP